jgi:hypothetical protein
MHDSTCPLLVAHLHHTSVSQMKLHWHLSTATADQAGQGQFHCFDAVTVPGSCHFTQGRTCPTVHTTHTSTLTFSYFQTVTSRMLCLKQNTKGGLPLNRVVASWNSQGTVPSRDGVQQAYLRLGTMFHARRNPTQTDSTSHVHGAPLIRTASAVTFG